MCFKKNTYILIRFLQRLLKSILNFQPQFVFQCYVNVGLSTLSNSLGYESKLYDLFVEEKKPVHPKYPGQYSICSAIKWNSNEKQDQVYLPAAAYNPGLSLRRLIWGRRQISPKYIKYFPNISDISNICQIFQILARTVLYLSSQPSSPWTLGRKKKFLWELFDIWYWTIIKMRTIKIEGPGAILVDLLDDVVDVVLGQLVVQLTQDLLQGVCK